MSFTLIGCTKPAVNTPTTGAPAAGTPQAAGKKEKLTVPTTGVLKGVVKYAGTPPAQPVDERIKKHMTDADKCLTGEAKDKINVQVQDWIVDANGGVANVV